jgi:hypothetical protein
MEMNINSVLCGGNQQEVGREKRAKEASMIKVHCMHIRGQVRPLRIARRWQGREDGGE